MKPFVISPSSLSYRLLSTLHPSYRWHKEYNSKTPAEIAERRKNAPGFKWYSQPHVAKDFCSYWRSVALTIAGLIVVAFVGYCTIRFWFNLGDLTQKTLPIFQSMMTAFGLIANAGIIGGIFVYCFMQVWPFVMQAYGRYSEWSHNRKRKNRKYDEDGDIIEPSHPIRDTCRMAYRSYKDKFCPMVEYTNEERDDSNTESY